MKQHHTTGRDSREVPTRRQVNWIKWTLIFAIVCQIGGLIYIEGQRGQQITAVVQQTQALGVAIQEDHDENVAAIQALGRRVDNVYSLVAQQGKGK